MKPAAKPAAMMDEALVTEISIGPDGRVCTFGLSREVLEVLAVLAPDNDLVHDRLKVIHQSTGPIIADHGPVEQPHA